MSILRFRVTFDDYDDIHRDIDLQADHTFADFFLEIMKSIGFDNKHVGEFFLADHNWRKGNSIGTISGTDLDRLKKVDMVDHIDDPHQKFLFVYDQEVRWSFNIELIKIILQYLNRIRKPIKSFLPFHPCLKLELWVLFQNLLKLLSDLG